MVKRSDNNDKDVGTRNQVSNQKESKSIPYQEADEENSGTRDKELCSQAGPQITSQGQRKGAPRHLIPRAD